MTDSTFCQLENLVEQALKPVWATRARKQLLRMELLAHIVDVFEEEFAVSRDEQAALNRTITRFGLAETVGSELQSSLSFANRWLHFLFKESSMKSWLWCLAVAAIFVGPGLIMPALGKFNQVGVLPLFPLLVGIAITVFGLVLAGFGLGRRFAHSS
jgi:hypothetical protein